MNAEPVKSSSQKPRRAVIVAKRSEGKAVGVVVLLIGLIAFAGMAYVGYQKFYGAKRSANIPIGIEDEADFTSAQSQPVSAPADIGKNAPAEKMFQGSWQSRFPLGWAFLQVHDGAFQLIYTDDPQGRARKYSRGTYKYDLNTGILALMPQSDFGEPKSVKGVSYAILTMRPYDVIIGRDNASGDIFWAPHKEGTRPDQTHPLFLITSTDQGAIRWTKTK